MWGGGANTWTGQVSRPPGNNTKEQNENKDFLTETLQENPPMGRNPVQAARENNGRKNNGRESRDGHRQKIGGSLQIKIGAEIKIGAGN